MAHRLYRRTSTRAPLLPGLQVLRKYERAWLRGDLLGGVTVAAYLVPQVMAYAVVAGLPPVVGLWASVAPLLIYAFLGSSRRLSVGPESSTALMTAAALGAMTLADPDRYAAAAAALALAVGVLCLVGRLVRLGFIADLLSRPVLIGYLAGIAILMIASQLPKLTGMTVDAGEPVDRFGYVLTHLDQVHGPTVVIALTVTCGLLVGQWLRPRWPNPMLAMLTAAAVAWLAGLDEHGVSTVGAIPRGLPVPGLPDVPLDVFLELALPAFGIAVVGYTDNMLTARAFAARHHEHVDGDQELFALGAVNVASALTHGFPVSSSGSRTVIGESLGVKSQAHSLFALATILLVMLALRPVLAAFPTAALAGVVVFAAIRLVDVAEVRRIARFRSSELVLTASTVFGVLVVGVLPGIGIAVALSILDLLRRVARGHDGILGYSPGLPGMHDVDDYPNATTVQGLVVYRYDSPLFFANADDFRERALASVRDAGRPVEWLLVNMESNVEVDLTALDALEDLRAELEAGHVTLALARVKQDLRVDLDRFGLTESVGANRIYLTLPTAVAAYAAEYAARHGSPPEGVPPTVPGTG